MLEEIYTTNKQTNKQSQATVSSLVRLAPAKRETDTEVAEETDSNRAGTAQTPSGAGGDAGVAAGPEMIWKWSGLWDKGEGLPCPTTPSLACFSHTGGTGNPCSLQLKLAAGSLGSPICWGLDNFWIQP